MVAIHDGHDHDDGSICPGCRFREVLAEFLARSHEEGRQEWHEAVGELRRLMHASLRGLDEIEAQPFADDDDPYHDPATDAADVIAGVGAQLEQLWNALMVTGDDD